MKWKYILSIDIKSVLILVFLVSYSALKAQDEDIGSIGTDRPVQSETPTVVPKGYIQAELGYQYEKGVDYQDFISNTYRFDETLMPNVLIKYGLIKNLELRMSANYLENAYIYKINGDEVKTAESGLTDPEFGLKYAILKESESAFNLTFSTHATVHLWADENFKSEDLNPRYRLTAGKSITDSWYILAGGEFSTSGNYQSGFYVLQTGYTFSRKLTALVEFYGYRDFEYRNALNGALVYLINNNHQIDVSAGMGLGDEEEGTKLYQHYIGIGYSFRIGLASK